MAPLDGRPRFDLTEVWEAGLRRLLDGVAVQSLTRFSGRPCWARGCVLGIRYRSMVSVAQVLRGYEGCPSLF